MDSEPVYDEARAKYVESSRKHSSRPPQLDVGDLVKLIIRQAQNRKHLRLVIDGINECNDPNGLLETLEQISKSARGVQILISSINEKGIEKNVTCMPDFHGITISPKDIRDDVGVLVHSTLSSHVRLKALPQALKDDIVNKLTKGAEGM